MAVGGRLALHERKTQNYLWRLSKRAAALLVGNDGWRLSCIRRDAGLGRCSGVFKSFGTTPDYNARHGRHFCVPDDLLCSR